MAYRELFRDALDQAIVQQIREGGNQCRVLGSVRFNNEIEAVLARGMRPGKPGRPKNKENLVRPSISFLLSELHVRGGDIPHFVDVVFSVPVTAVSTGNTIVKSPKP